MALGDISFHNLVDDFNRPSLNLIYKTYNDDSRYNPHYTTHLAESSKSIFEVICACKDGVSPSEDIVGSIKHSTEKYSGKSCCSTHSLRPWGKEVCIEMKNDVVLTGTLLSVDQYLNMLANVVVDSTSHPQLSAMKNCFIRGSVVRYIQIPKEEVDTELLQDAARKEALK